MKTGIKRSIYLVAIAHQGLIHRARRETSTLRQRYYLSKVVPFQRRSFLKFYSFFFLLSGGKRKASAKSKTSARLDTQKDTSHPHSYAAAARPRRACLRPPEKRRKQNHACSADQKANEFRNNFFFFKLPCILIWHKDSALVYKTLCSSYFSCACPGMYRAFLPLVLRFIQPQNFEDKDCVPNLYSVAWSEPKSRVFGFP